MKTYKEFFEDLTHYPAMIDPKIDKSKDDWVKGDPTEPIDVSDNSGDMKSVLDKANRDVEKERGTKIKPFVESKEVEEAKQGHALVVGGKIVARGSKSALLKKVKKDKIKLDPKGDQNFLTYTGKEVGDSW